MSRIRALRGTQLVEGSAEAQAIDIVAATMATNTAVVAAVSTVQVRPSTTAVSIPAAS